MDYKELSLQLKNNEFSNYMSDDIRKFIVSTDILELEKHLERVMTSPIKYINNFDRPLYQIYFTAAWSNLFKFLHKDKQIELMEVASGDANYILNALDNYSSEFGSYITFNINKSLTNNLKTKNAQKSVQIKVIEDNGMNALKYFDENSFDFIGFHHAINDIIQTIIAEIEGIDTENCDWWGKEPDMLHAVMKHYKQGTLKTNAYDSFIKLIDVCTQVLMPGGYMIFDNCSFVGYDDIGYSTEFHNSYINMAREWINESGLPLKEITVDGYNSKWWLILRKG